MGAGAKCPSDTKCQTRFIWDWDQDVYQVVKGENDYEDAPTKVLDKEGDKMEVLAFYCPDCGYPLGFRYSHNDFGCFVYSPDSWKKVDWGHETDENMR